MSPVATQSVTTTRTFEPLEIATSDLWPSPFNPRKTIKRKALEELAASIKAEGVIEPLVVRRRENSDGATFEIAAGERRWRAAQLVNESPLPCVVRDLSDAQMIELALSENSQRDDIHPLEEADAIQQLLNLDSAATIASVATTMGKDYRWVYDRLKLLRMSEAAQAAYRAEAITDDHAEILARVPVHQQDGALVECFSQMLYEIPDVLDGGDDDLPYRVDDAVAQRRWDLLAGCLSSPSSLKKWLASHSTADIADQVVQDTMPQLSEALADAAADEARLVQLSEDDQLRESEAKTLGVIRRVRWVEIIETGKNVPGRVSTKRCEYMKPGVVTHPPAALRPVAAACFKRGCTVHRPAPTQSKGDAQVSARDNKAEEKRLAQEAAATERARVWNEEQRPKYLAALATLVGKVKVVTPELVKSFTQKHTLEDIASLYGVKLTPQTAVTVLLLSFAPLGEWALRQDSHSLVNFGKVFGLTPAEWEKAQKATAKETKATTAAKKPSPAKAAAKAKKKGAR